MKLNKKGFTLVELLAVIVVLAVIMVIAIPTVIDSMNSAKKSSFAMYGQKMLNAAMSKVQGDALDGVPAKKIYKFSELVSSSGQYKGYVYYADGTYKVVFYNTDYTTVGSNTADDTIIKNGATYDDLENWKKADCSLAAKPAACTKVKAAADSSTAFKTETAGIDTVLSK